MENIIDLFRIDNKKDFAIELKRSEEFYKTAQKLSDYIKKLPLSNDENDTLVSIILEHVTAAEKSAFAQGFNMAMDFAESCEEEPHEVPEQ